MGGIAGHSVRRVMRRVFLVVAASVVIPHGLAPDRTLPVARRRQSTRDQRRGAALRAVPPGGDLRIQRPCRYTARFGRPIGGHAALLRDHQMSPQELFAVTHDSTTYNEGDRRSLFHAQSWLLIHYAFVENPDRWKQLIQFETLMDAGAPIDGAFQRVFNATFFGSGEGAVQLR